MCYISHDLCTCVTCNVILSILAAGIQTGSQNAIKNVTAVVHGMAGMYELCLLLGMQTSRSRIMYNEK